MERKIESVLKKWHDCRDRKALLIKGCRQIGKTYSILEFARSNYRNVIYIDFDQKPEYSSIFSSGTDAGSILENMGYTEFGSLMVPGETVIIFDEVQSCEAAFSALKPLVLEGSYDYIASGSLLGVDLSEGLRSPMGYLKIVDMHPMDFEEYLWANGIGRKQTDSIREHIRSMTPFTDFQLDRLLELFLRYLVIGGMPEAVSTYVERRNYADVVGVYEDILTILRRDAMRYSPKSDKMRISACLDSVPEQLGKENNTFTYYDVQKIRGVGRDFYGPSIDWLIGSGFAIKVNNVTEPREPLRRNIKERSFKIYMADTGLLTYMMGPNMAGMIAGGDHMVNNGAVMENAVEIMLATNGFRTYFFQKSNSTLEIDFLINRNGSLTAVEVKSGRYDYPKSLITVMSDRYGVEKGILLEKGNIRVDEHGVIHYPLFAPCFFENDRPAEMPPVDGIDRLNEELEGRTASAPQASPRRIGPRREVSG